MSQQANVSRTTHGTARRGDGPLRRVTMDQPDRHALSEICSWHVLADVAWRAASEAGAFLHTQRPVDLVVETKSTPTDAVTAMDKAAEDLIRERLLGERPEDGLLGEEGTDRPSRSGVRWVVDPLDGTVNYLYGIPLWGVSVAAEDLDLGAAVVGVVITPETGEGFIAIRGRGAYRVLDDVGERLSVRACTDLGLAMVATGFGYAPGRRSRQVRTLQSIITSVRDIRRTGCAVVDFTWLAQGRTDAYYERGLNPWDMAAGMLIAEEAGAVISDLGGASGEGTFLASVPGIATELSGLLLQAGVHQPDES